MLGESRLATYYQAVLRVLRSTAPRILLHHATPRFLKISRRGLQIQQRAALTTITTRPDDLSIPRKEPSSRVPPVHLLSASEGFYQRMIHILLYRSHYIHSSRNTTFALKRTLCSLFKRHYFGLPRLVQIIVYVYISQPPCILSVPSSTLAYEIHLLSELLHTHRIYSCTSQVLGLQ